MAGGITIRAALAEDAPALSRIQTAAFRPLWERYHDADNPCLRGPEDILRRLDTPEYSYFCVLEGGLLVGGVFFRCTGIAPFGEELGEGRYYLQRAYIAPDRQSKGLARQAILLCERELPGFRCCTVDFPADLEKNRRCYTAAGYSDTGMTMPVLPGLTLSHYIKTTAAADGTGEGDALHE